ncbi:DNA double-strand break repair nuclease NurA [Chloroflexota bacterium]
MSLDFDKVALQIRGMITKLVAGSAERQEHLRHAVDTFNQNAGNFEFLQKKIAVSKTTWLVAGLVEGLAQHHVAPPVPAEFTVIATDGSHIDVDRHKSTRCCLINIGTIILNYGDNHGCVLDSTPCLYSGEEDLVIMPTDGKRHEQVIEGGLLGVKRSVEELHKLAEVAAGLPAASSSLALLDGSLILWGLEAYPDFVTGLLLEEGFLSYLSEVKKLNSDKRLAMASYISYPRSTDVVNALRVALCPYDPPDCDRYCLTKEKRECDAVAGIRDRELFAEVLDQGERSAIFVSPSKIQKYYGEHQVHFFYVRVGDEIARIEIPRWVAADDDLLGLTHTLVLDQCNRGHGYPVALSEAHEKAVVTTADRENFWQMVEASLVEEQVSTFNSAKSRSKKTRWV